MATIPKNDYSTQVISGDPAYPQGRARNVITTGDGSGTPLEQKWVNDIWGFLQSLLDRAGITPSGLPDEVGASQYMDAIDFRFGTTGNLVGISSEPMAGAMTSHIFSTTAQTNNPLCATVSTDGGFLYVVGDDERIYQYTLTTPFDQSTAIFHSSKVMSVEFARVDHIFWSDDGGNLYVTGSKSGGGNYVYRLLCGTPWIAASGSISSNYQVTEHANNAISSASLSDDGTKLYVLGLTGAGKTTLEQYLLTSAWDLSVVTPTGTADLTTLSGITSFYSHSFSDDFTRLFCMDTSGNLREFQLGTGGNVSTVSYTGRYRAIDTLFGSGVGRMTLSPNGERAYFNELGGSTDRVISLYASVVRLA